ncbi:hypothetical protein PRIC1_009900 [Phytophthora ramorum]
MELLAYQFASPAQWITTQALLFSEGGVHRFVEIGAALMLTNMALRTLQVGDFLEVSREILWYQRDRGVVHFEEESSNISILKRARDLAETAAAAVPAPKVEGVADRSGCRSGCCRPVQVQAVPVAASVASATHAADDAPVTQSPCASCCTSGQEAGRHIIEYDVTQQIGSGERDYPRR